LVKEEGFLFIIEALCYVDSKAFLLLVDVSRDPSLHLTRSEAYFFFNHMQPLSEELDHSSILLMSFIVFVSPGRSMDQDLSKKTSDKIPVDVGTGPSSSSIVPPKKTSAISKHPLIRS